MSQLLIKNINLIDGTGSDNIINTDVLIEDGRFKSLDASDAGDAEVIEGGGRYMLPGMIDAHVHMMMELKPLEQRLTTPFSYNFYEAAKYLNTVLNAGVTTVRDALGSDLGLKKAIEDGLVDGPRMQISVNALTITGGHGDGYNYSGVVADLLQPHPGMPSGVCDGVEEVRKKTREMLRAGADVIKVHATGGVSSPTDHPKFTQFSLEELKVIVEEAQFRNGVKVMAHAQGLEGIRQCVEAGIHSIEHGIYLDDEICGRMKDEGTYLVPTLLAPVSVLEFADELGMAQTSIDKSKEVIEIHRESFTRAYKAGVKIAMGTDAGVFKHGTNLRELELMVECGMTPMDAIVASTQTAAECMGYTDLGLIKEDYVADFILTEENPLDDIGILKNNDAIKVVAKDGKVFKNTI
ncbi:metal-dependent hydrolase family protein [Lacicoccus alkaliphilus]|uniref:Imidazolonepropionase n=1 Tax=Lacicoccus alkaliphilus DSM 16010 TaxID=1123231 RepID=A0A1M7DUX3_9BACL|nr:amidohydrolase family protein [Salinicoccus alkaliphilus]SHL83256.1 Imidazolonepropionase [Salinicoccus alkaliphilus DSM 16010]